MAMTLRLQAEDSAALARTAEMEQRSQRKIRVLNGLDMFGVSQSVHGMARTWPIQVSN
jgi:hypothetical protein